MNRTEALTLLRSGKQGILRWNALRSEGVTIPDLDGADLRGLDLEGVDLSDARLSNAMFGPKKPDSRRKKSDSPARSEFSANLREANLRRAVLQGTSLVCVDLSNAHLDHANLTCADLRGADLTNASLRGAGASAVQLTSFFLNLEPITGTPGITKIPCCLNGANFSGASLMLSTIESLDTDGANLQGAYLSHNRLDCDLGAIQGLSEVVHIGASTLSLAALTSFRDVVPSTFLRGSGVSDQFIECARSLLGASQFYSAFISYSHSDKLFTQRLHDALQSKGIRCWLDDKDAEVGGDILDLVNNAIRRHDRLLLCCSRASLTSSWVDRELNITLDKERREQRKTILPLNLDGFLFDGYEGKFAGELRSRVAPDFTGWASDPVEFDNQVARVVRALEQGG